MITDEITFIEYVRVAVPTLAVLVALQFVVIVPWLDRRRKR